MVEWQWYLLNICQIVSSQIIGKVHIESIILRHNIYYP